jgi:hypothetical protein
MCVGWAHRNVGFFDDLTAVGGRPKLQTGRTSDVKSFVLSFRLVIASLYDNSHPD